MTLRRTVIGLGLGAVVFGIWTLTRAHAQIGTCTTISGRGAIAHSGIDSSCVQTLMSYSMGFVFVASGVIIAIIALTMIAKQERIDLRSELKAVPRTWGQRHYVTTGEGLNSVDGLDALDSPLPVGAPLYAVEI